MNNEYIHAHCQADAPVMWVAVPRDGYVGWCTFYGSRQGATYGAAWAERVVPVYECDCGEVVEMKEDGGQ